MHLSALSSDKTTVLVLQKLSVWNRIQRQIMTVKSTYVTLQKGQENAAENPVLQPLEHPGEH